MMKTKRNNRGLTLDQIKLRHAINEIKIAYEKERVASTFASRHDKPAKEDNLSIAYANGKSIVNGIRSVIESYMAIKNLVGMCKTVNK